MPTSIDIFLYKKPAPALKIIGLPATPTVAVMYLMVCIRKAIFPIGSWSKSFSTSPYMLIKSSLLHFMENIAIVGILIVAYFLYSIVLRSIFCIVEATVHSSDGL